MRLHDRRVGRRAPPAFELPRVGPQLPHPLDRRSELCDQDEAETLEVLLDADHGHVSFTAGGTCASRSAIRPTRPRHAGPARRGPAVPGRPRRRRYARAARGRALLGDQAGPLQHRDVLLHGGEAHRKPSARRETDGSPPMQRWRMSRRVASASAWKRRSTSASVSRTHNHSVVDYQSRTFSSSSGSKKCVPRPSSSTCKATPRLTRRPHPRRRLRAGDG